MDDEHLAGDDAVDAEELAQIFPLLYEAAIRLLGKQRDQGISPSDLVQTAFKSYLSNIRHGQPKPNSLLAMLLKILRRKALRRIVRRRKRPDGQPLEASETEPTTFDPGDPEVQEDIEKMLSRLPSDVHRTVALLTAADEKQAAIARHLGVSERYVRRILSEVRDLWSSYGYGKKS